MATPVSRLVDDILLHMEAVVKVECLTLEELICDESMGRDKELLAVCAQRFMTSLLEAAGGGERRPARRFAERCPWSRETAGDRS